MTTPPEAAPMRADVTPEQHGFDAFHAGAARLAPYPPSPNAVMWLNGWDIAQSASRLAHTARPGAGDGIEALVALIPSNIGPLHPQSFPDDIIVPVDMTAGEIRRARAALFAMREGVDGEMVKRTEVQALWRCAIGDMVGAMDILAKQWRQSKRKAERQSGEELSGVLDLVWAYRDPAPSSYEDAKQNGRTLADRVRSALSARIG
jgi:hypothetical protein